MKQSLEDQIRDLGGPSLSEARKGAIKNAVFSSIKAMEDVKQVAMDTEMAFHDRVMLLERLREFMESRSRRFSFFSLALFRRQFAAALLILVMVMGGFSFVNVETDVVFAAEFTQLADVSGEVVIERKGESLDAYKGMQLYEKDKVYTRDNAEAAVRFFDDSVSRLSAQTVVEIDELKGSQFGVSSYVEIEVENGQVWSKVVNLVADDSAFVVKGNGLIAEAKKGAFNVSVNNDNVELGVFSNEVKVTGEKFKDEVKVVTGQKLVTKKKYNFTPLVVSLPSSDKETKWAKDNLADDKQYIVEVENRLIAAKMESIGLEVDESVSLDNSVREDTLQFLTFNDVSQQKLALDLAEKRFVTAQLKLIEKGLDENDRIEAQKAIEDFYLAVKVFYDFAASVGATDKAYGEELRKYAQDKILTQKKLLSATLPDSPYYFAKDVIENIELIGVEGVELAKKKQNQAQDKLATVEEVVNNGDLNLATKVLEDYQQDISEVVTILDEGDDVNVEDKNEIIQNVKDDSVMLMAIDDAVDLKDLVEVEILDEPKQQEKEQLEEEGKESEENEVKQDSEEEPESGQSESTENKLLDSKLNLNFQIKQNLDFSNLIIDGPFGVQIQGDKPLDPLL